MSNYDFSDEGNNASRWSASLRRTFVDDFRDTIVVCVPSAVYFVQNVLLYVAASNLDVASYQITYQVRWVLSFLLGRCNNL